MSVLAYTIILFTVAFFIHLIIWKICLPRNQTRALVLIFSAILIFGILLLKISLDQVNAFDLVIFKTIYGYLQLCLLFVSLTLAYIVTYSGLEVDSPSLVMVMKIAQAGPHGLNKNILEANMNDDLLVLPRLRDLLSARMVYLDRGKYKLKGAGLLVARIFVVYRKLLKLEKGG